MNSSQKEHAQASDYGAQQPTNGQQSIELNNINCEKWVATLKPEGRPYALPT
jgi:hypothetical protein